MDGEIESPEVVVKDRTTASQELRVALTGIAKHLKQTESARGRRIRKERKDGHELEWVPDPPDDMGLNVVTFINVKIDLWRELGAILERIAKGENARQLFGQHLRTNPSKDGEHRKRALAYWSIRARDPKAGDAEALDYARKIVPISKILRPDTLRKYAQRHRARCLCLLSLHPNWVFKFESSAIEISALGSGIAPLVNYLRKKESSERWRLPPPFKTIADVLSVKSAGADQAAFPGMSLCAEELPPGVSLRIKKRDALLGNIRVRSRADGPQE
jgi:hypothetical protein